VIRETGDSHVFGAGREIRAESAQGQARVARCITGCVQLPMDSVVFSEQVGRGLAGCEGLRGTVFFGVDRFFDSLHNAALKSLELRAEMFPSCSSTPLAWA
jgi:hypothetical protein